jgi:hypothetical protein
MATTVKPRGSKERTPRPGPQAPPGVWTPENLAAALAPGTLEEEVALLRVAGILDKRGDLAKKYRSWGRKASRTPEVEEGGS